MRRFKCLPFAFILLVWSCCRCCSLIISACLSSSSVYCFSRCALNSFSSRCRFSTKNFFSFLNWVFSILIQSTLCLTWRQVTGWRGVAREQILRWLDWVSDYLVVYFLLRLFRSWRLSSLVCICTRLVFAPFFHLEAFQFKSIPIF